ncbi:inversin-like isoform X2 [Scylla paramamosain]|uniref:inversin-like isoform X2 n=1 Tax=Scylla paramamosain TaxID=85552 RepID=UPI003083A941
MDSKKQSAMEAVASSVLTPAPHSCPTQASCHPVRHASSQGSEAREKNSTVGPEMYTSNPNQINFVGLLHMMPSSDTAGLYTCNTPFQQVLNFNSSLVHYQRSQGPASGYPAGPGCLLPPGLPQLPSTPGFLTGAGYHLPLNEASLLGSQRFPMCTLLPPGQTGTPLHFAAIVGDKQKLAIALQDKNVNLEARDRWGRVALVFAVLGNHQECVELLLHAGAKPDAVDSHRRTPLHFAAYKGHLGCIKSILHTVESKNISHSEHSNGVWLAQDVKGVTPLHHAATHSNHKCLQALLKHTVAGTLDTEDHKKRTPLHWAAAYGSQENVRLLIKHGANNLMPDQEGKTPLHWAAMSKADGARDCVRTLIGAAPSNVNWQDFDGTTALHIAVAEARKETVDVILSVQNCNVNLTDNQFRTALHWACNRGVSAIAAHLMKRVAQVDAVDIYGATPLHYASKHNHADIVELLVRRPRVRDVPTLDGHTSLMWAAAQGADSALTVMVRHGALLTQADPRGCTALHIAAEAGHVSTVRVLLRLQAPPDACANDGRTPVHYAARAGHTQIVKVLAKAGASLEHRDKEGQCALHHAVLGGHLFLAQILIRAGTSVNVQDYYGRPPLHMAAYRGLSDIMCLLLENRGDVNARDFEGLSALHWAAEQGHLGAVNTLLVFNAYPNYTQSTPNRYTPYDCACIAEHLEVAQVLSEAGGISVTRIMEVAATKIQSVMRGYLTRKKLGRQQRPLLDQEGDKMRGSRKSPSSHSKDFSPNKCSGSQAAPETDHPGKQKGSDLPATPAVETKLASLKKEEKGLTSKLSFPLRSTASEYGPYNSVSGQRRSKALPTSIMRGARKKTPRNLELPGLCELGISQPRLPGPLEDCEDSDSGTDITEGVRPLVTEVLHQSGSVATAVITVGVHSHQTQEESDLECRKQWDFSPSSVKGSHATELQQSCSQTVSDGKKIGRLCFNTDNNEDDSSSDLYCQKEDTFSICKNQTKKESDYQETFKNDHAKSFNETLSLKDNTKLYIKERKHVLKENKFISPEGVNDRNADPRNTARIQNERRVLSEEAVKEAEQKWRNKLATVTIQRVQPPGSSRSKVSSYSIVKPHSPTPLQSPAGIEADAISTKPKEVGAHYH